VSPARPDVSVVIPTTGRWGLLRHTLASALGQRGVDHELIVVHDGRTEDGLAELTAVDDPRLRVLRTAGGTGAPAARNRGLEEVRADRVSFLDDDDLWSPHKLRGQLAVANRGARWVFTDAVDIDSAGRVIDAGPPPDVDEVRARLPHANVIPAGNSNVLVDVSLLREVGGFDPALNATCDWDLWLRLLARAVPGRHPGVHIAYRRHDSNMHAGDYRALLEELDRLERKHRAAGFDPDRVQIMRWLAGGQRRAGSRPNAARLYWESARRHRSIGDLVRFIGLAGGERAMALGRRLTRPGRGGPLPVVGWLGSGG
jgi:glycosyltransferase involved in cell wall biosynthesis